MHVKNFLNGQAMMVEQLTASRYVGKMKDTPDQQMEFEWQSGVSDCDWGSVDAQGL